MHETPYLRGGNNARLSIGNTFSNEPGIYIPSEVGLLL
jgi:Xaa-Pro aminopeptidase